MVGVVRSSFEVQWPLSACIGDPVRVLEAARRQAEADAQSFGLTVRGTTVLHISHRYDRMTAFVPVLSRNAWHAPGVVHSYLRTKESL